MTNRWRKSCHRGNHLRLSGNPEWNEVRVNSVSWVLGARLTTIEEDRPVFFLATPGIEAGLPPGDRGQLYRSGDGGLTWQSVELPGGAAPTALAISPHFAEDGVVFVGAAGGQVLEVNNADLRPTVATEATSGP